MSRIGFIGLGIVGAPTACHLAEPGHEVIGHTHDPAAYAPSVADGRSADSVEAAADGDREARRTR